MKKAKPLKSGDAKLQGLRRDDRYASQLPVEVDGKVCPLVQILLMGGILDEACQVFKYWIVDPGLINPL